MNMNELTATASAMVAPGKGILAADESGGTIKKRFDTIDVESTEESRRAYRELLFTTDGAEEFVSGVIMFDESLRQSTPDGVPFAEVLGNRGVIAGIKPDRGAKDLAGFPGEKVTEGLAGLRERLQEYWEPGSASGGLSSRSGRASLPGSVSTRTRTPWPDTPLSARRSDWCRSWNRKC